MTTPQLLYVNEVNHIIGRFPPPLDGQTVMTRRLAEMIEQVGPVRRVDLSTGEAGHAESDVAFSFDKVRHYWGRQQELREALAEGDGVVLWTSISPSTLGHFRDLVTVQPALAGRTRVYGVVHWGKFHELFERPTTRLTAERLVSNLAGLVFLSDTLAERCAPWVADEKRLVIPNTIGDDLRCSEGDVLAKQQGRQERAALRLLFLSNMTPAKGYSEVIEAARVLRERGRAFTLELAGRWETETDKADFERYVADHHLGDHVMHHGGVKDRTRVRDLHLRADAFLLPTYYPTEAQPLTIIEAMNAGTPIVTTRHAGIPDMLEDEREGLFVPAKDARSLANAIERLYDVTFWTRLSQGARLRFLEQFRPEVVAEMWAALVRAAQNREA
ncbi:MAG: glycosyltransferase family 4 protein [Bacteroidota bacterium]